MCFFFFFCVVFFFQAEDGIRDLVRSRGLGDVYKRQSQFLVVLIGQLSTDPTLLTVDATDLIPTAVGVASRAVSYTHLTLPTSDLV